MSGRADSPAKRRAAPMRFLLRDPSHPDAAALLGELDAALTAITGCSGNTGFDPDDVRVPGAAFAVAYRAGAPVACGGYRPVREGVAEVKRVYAREHGAGLPLLRKLEALARGAGYRRLVCETRRANVRAVAFYLRAGWRETPPYGRYIGRPEAICFERILEPGADV